MLGVDSFSLCGRLISLFGEELFLCGGLLSDAGYCFSMLCRVPGNYLCDGSNEKYFRRLT